MGRGRKIEVENGVRASYLIPANDKLWVEQQAETHGLTASEVVREMLKYYRQSIEQEKEVS